MAVVEFAYTLSVCEWLKDCKKVPVKKYKCRLVNKAYSVFRIGLDKLSTLCYTMEAFLTYLIENIITKIPSYKSKNSIIAQ